MDYQTTLAGRDDVEKKTFPCRKTNRGLMDSFENFLGDFDATKSSGDINFVLKSAQRIANAEGDSDSEDNSIYEDLQDDSGHRHKLSVNPIDAMHHSGALEKMFRKPGAKVEGHATQKKAGRRPKAPSRSPTASSDKRASPSQNSSPSSSHSMKKPVTSPKIADVRKTPTRTRSSQESLSRTQHTATSSSSKMNDDLSKSEHRAPRMRRNDLYSSRHRASGNSGSD